MVAYDSLRLFKRNLVVFFFGGGRSLCGRPLPSPLAGGVGALRCGRTGRHLRVHAGTAVHLGTKLREHLRLWAVGVIGIEHLLLHCRLGGLRCSIRVARHPSVGRSVSNRPRHYVLPTHWPLVLWLAVRARSWHVGREERRLEGRHQKQNRA